MPPNNIISHHVSHDDTEMEIIAHHLPHRTIDTESQPSRNSKDVIDQKHSKDERHQKHNPSLSLQSKHSAPPSSFSLPRKEEETEEEPLPLLPAPQLDLDVEDEEENRERTSTSSSFPAPGTPRFLTTSSRSTPRALHFDYTDAGTPCIPIPPPIAIPALLVLSTPAPGPAPSHAPAAWRVYLALVAAQLCWSGFHVLGKYTFTFLSPFVLPTFRTIGVVPVLAYYAYRRDPKFYVISPRNHLLMFIEALLGNTIAQQAFNYATSLSSASLAGMCQPSIPVFTTIIAIVLRREGVSVMKVAGICIAIAGSLVMVLGSGGSGGDESVDGSNYTLGAILFIIQCLTTSVYIIIQKPMFASGVDVRTFTFYLFFYGGVGHVLVGAFFLPSVPWASLPLTLIPILLYLVLIASFAAFSLFVFATNNLPASISSLGITLQSFFSPLLGSIVLGEVITLTELMGGVAIVAGIVVVVLAKGREGTGVSGGGKGVEGVAGEKDQDHAVHGKEIMSASDDDDVEPGGGDVGHPQKSQRISTQEDDG